MIDTIYLACHGCGWVFRAEADGDSVHFTCSHCGYVHFLHDSRGTLSTRRASSPCAARGAQSWFWTPEWQAMEREADGNLANGNYVDFGTMDEFIDDLEKPTE